MEICSVWVDLGTDLKLKFLIDFLKISRIDDVEIGKSAVLFAQNSTELGENIRAFGNCLDKNPESDLFDCHFGWFLTSFMLIGTSMLLQG